MDRVSGREKVLFRLLSTCGPQGPKLMLALTLALVYRVYLGLNSSEIIDWPTRV